MSETVIHTASEDNHHSGKSHKVSPGKKGIASSDGIGAILAPTVGTGETLSASTQTLQAAGGDLVAGGRPFVSHDMVPPTHRVDALDA